MQRFAAIMVKRIVLSTLQTRIALFWVCISTELRHEDSRECNSALLLASPPYSSFTSHHSYLQSYPFVFKNTNKQGSLRALK